MATAYDSISSSQPNYHDTTISSALHRMAGPCASRNCLCSSNMSSPADDDVTTVFCCLTKISRFGSLDAKGDVATRLQETSTSVLL